MKSRFPITMMYAVIFATTPAQAKIPALHTDAQIVSFTDRVVRLNRLSANTNCLQYSADTSQRGRIYVKAFEIHDKVCGGDRQTQPLLFTVRYDLRVGSAATDKGSVDGAFHPIRTPAS